MLYTIQTTTTVEIDAETEDEAVEFFRTTLINKMTSAAAEKKDAQPRCISAMISAFGDAARIKDGGTVSDFHSLPPIG